MSLTKVTYSMIYGSPVNVLDFGADPTGAAFSDLSLTLLLQGIWRHRCSRRMVRVLRHLLIST